jgi:hypothetical protein
MMKRGSAALALIAGALCASAPIAEAQRGGRFPGGNFYSSFGDPNDFYTPPAFHGNPPYSGRFVFARLKYRGYFAFGREGPGWSHDYPDADEHLMRILRDVTTIRPFVLEDDIAGGAIVAFDDPQLMKYPVAYLSEPGGLSLNGSEQKGLKKYLTNGGFIIVDDDNRFHFQNLMNQTAQVFPELKWVQLTGKEPLFDSFFAIDTKKIEQQCAANRQSCYRGIPHYWALFENNDPKKHMMMLCNVDADIGEFWQWSAQGFAPVDVSNEAYKLGINYIVYALTHP